MEWRRPPPRAESSPPFAACDWRMRQFPRLGLKHRPKIKEQEEETYTSIEIDNEGAWGK